MDDVTAWLKVNLGNIFEYILETKEFGEEYIGKYKDHKTCSYFDIGFFGEILLSKINNGTKIALLCSIQGSKCIHKTRSMDFSKTWCYDYYHLAFLHGVSWCFFALLLVNLWHVVVRNHQKNHRSEKDKLNCFLKKDQA